MPRGFLDAQCFKCKAKIGWMGSMLDRPPCPKCGHAFTKEELQQMEDALEIMLEGVRKKAEARATAAGIPLSITAGVIAAAEKHQFGAAKIVNDIAECIDRAVVATNLDAKIAEKIDALAGPPNPAFEKSVEDFMNEITLKEGDMVVIRVELWRQGDPERSELLEIGTITNVGVSAENTGSYRVSLQKSPRFMGPKLPDPDSLPWKAGTVSGFPRKLSAWELLKRALNAINL